MSPEQVTGFWLHVDRSGGPAACWPWIGDHVRKGYGRFLVGRRELKPHRVALTLALGRDLGAAVARHTCDNPPCCNPAHLLPGTSRENTQDAKERGRLRAGAGERHGTKTHPESHAKGEASVLAKVTNADVLAMRAAYAAGGVTQAALSARYGITRESVGNILRGKTWAHLTLDRSAAATVSREHRGRNARQNGGVKLTEAAVLDIRRRLADGTENRAQLAREYGVSWTTIHFVATGQNWRHVDNPD